MMYQDHSASIDAAQRISETMSSRLSDLDSTWEHIRSVIADIKRSAAHYVEQVVATPEHFPTTHRADNAVDELERAITHISDVAHNVEAARVYVSRLTT